MTEKKCLKFEGYIFMPDKKDNFKAMRSYASKTMGRIQVFDSNNEKQWEKYKAFTNVGEMLDLIMRAGLIWE